MPKPGTNRLLKEIKSGDIEWIYVHITEVAIEWAAAGFVEEANNLLEQLWKFGIPHSRNLWLGDRGLQVMWEVTGKWPANIPFQLMEISEIEWENWERNFTLSYDISYTSQVMKQRMEELHGHELFVKAITSAGEQSENNIKIFENLKRFIENDNPNDYEYLKASTCGALLAANQNQDLFAIYFIKHWGKAHLKINIKIELPSLMSYRKTAIYLQQGILRELFNINSDQCKAECDQIIKALSNRMADGRTLVYGNLSWSELLNTISKLAIEQKTIDFTEDILKRGTLTKPAALKTEIEATENRLNILLPEDYKKFLLASNGFDCFITTGVTISSVDKIDYFANVSQQIIDTWTDIMDDIDPVFCKKLKSSIIIGGHREEQQLLLIPGEENTWECWHFWSPGESVYQDFRFYMEEELQRLEDNFYIS